MNIPVSEIIGEKLAQLEADGTIRKKIESAVEKSVTDAIVSEIESYAFKNKISAQVRDALGAIAADCGISAYNSFIAEKVKSVVKSLCTDEISQKVTQILEGVVLKKYESVKLSEIFQKYREFVYEHVDQSDKEDYREYTARIESSYDGSFTRYFITFSEKSEVPRDEADVVIQFYRYNHSEKTTIFRVFLNGHELTQKTQLPCYIDDFEAFVLNLYYNSTPIIMDVDDVDSNTDYDIYDDSY